MLFCCSTTSDRQKTNEKSVVTEARGEEMTEHFTKKNLMLPIIDQCSRVVLCIQSFKNKCSIESGCRKAGVLRHIDGINGAAHGFFRSGVLSPVALIRENGFKEELVRKMTHGPIVKYFVLHGLSKCK